MSNAEYAVPDFLKEFVDYERNRMYPPNYIKECAMKRLSLKYFDTLSRAETNTLKCFDPSIVPQIRRELDDDLLRLADLKRLILRIIYEPGLPLTNIDLDQDLGHGTENPES